MLIVTDKLFVAKAFVGALIMPLFKHAVCIYAYGVKCVSNEFIYFFYIPLHSICIMFIYVCSKMLHMSYESTQKKSQRINLEAQDICEL